MWRTLTLFFFIINILRFGSSQETNSTTTATTNATATTPVDNSTTSQTTSVTSEIPTTPGNQTEPPPNPRCLSPTDRKEGWLPDFYVKDAIRGVFNNMRRVLPLGKKPKKNQACIVPTLIWDGRYENSALFKAMLCPTPDTGPDKIFYNRTENYGEIIFFGTPNSTESLVADANLWKVEVKAMSDADWTSTIKSYKRGPWDPAFQIIWRETTRFGCSLVKYNNTDLAELSRIFKKQVTQPMTLNTLVCHFSPAGCIEGEKPFVCTEIPSVGPLPPYIPSVNPFPPESSVRPFSSARKLSVDMGFNFGTLFVSYMLFEHLVLSL